MIDTVVYISQLILLLCLVTEKRVQCFLFGMATVFLLNLWQFGSGEYYLRCFSYDVIQIVFALVFLNKTKAAVVSCICLFSVWMNLYEHFSTYQTFLYNYRDIIQFWLAELMIVVAIWKTKWRKIACLYSQKKC